MRMIDDETALPEALLGKRWHELDIYQAPEWYDVDYAGYRGEEAFYRLVLERCAKGGRLVVELGAGTGRLALRFVAAGFRVHAVEPAPAMRALLLEKAAAAGLAGSASFTVEDALAATFAPPERPSVVLFPFNGLLHLRTTEELHASFRHIRETLAPDGRFALDCTGPYWDAMLFGPTAWGRADERVHPATGAKVLTCDRSGYDATTRQMRIDIRYLIEGTDEGVQIELRQTMWTWQQVLAALNACGFVVEQQLGDVDLAPFDEGSPRLLVCAACR
ncbi:MAG: class I SAM-dependent methyltransferase [Deltaproteobacteria bacterium]|nr:class I SAM-dependent methyltransferase [Deltaproteobacteria bacterium]